MASGRDRVTKKDVDDFLAKFPKQPRSATKRGFDAQIKGVKSFQTELEYSPGKSGKGEYRLGKGKSYNEINDPKTKEYLDSTRRIDAEAAALGKPRKEKKSLFNKTIDVLSRGNFASAEAFKEAFDPKTKAKWEPKEALKGFWSGLQGKEKTTFKDVLTQHGHTGKGMGTLGFALDVVADPLTWTGAGAVVKGAAKSKEIVKQLDEVGKVQSELIRKGADATQVREAMNTAAMPVQKLKKRSVKKLSTEGRQVYDFALDARGADNSRAVEKIVTGWKRRVGNAAHVDLRAFPDDKLRQIAVDAVRAEEKAHPGVTSMLRRVRATKTGSGAPADSYGSYTRWKSGNIDGTIRMDPKLSGDRKYMEQYVNSGNEVPLKIADADEAIRYMTTHEVGHQFGQFLDDAAKVALVSKVEAKFGKDWADQLSAYANRKEYSHEPAGAKRVEEMTAEAWAEYRIMGDKARPMAKFIADEMIKATPKAPSMADTDAILKELSDDFIESDVKNINEWAETQILKENGIDPQDILAVETFFESGVDTAKRINELAEAKLAERGMPDIKAAKAATHEQLLAITARNINPAVKKQFALKIGPTAVGIPKSAEAVEKVQKALTSIPGIKQSVDKFNELFRATAHIPPGLNHLRAQQQGLGIALVTQHLKSLEYAFGGLKKADRTGLLKAIRDGATEGNITKGGVDLYGQPIPDMVKYITNQIETLDADRMLRGIEVDELNAFLGGKFAIRESGKKTRERVVPYTDEFGRKATKRETVETKELTADVIKRAILKNPAIDDPAQALYLYTSAMNQAIAKRDLWTTIANTHGVPVGDLGKQLVSKHGWVEVEKIKGAEGFLFPPEVAEGMAKIQTVFSDARTTGQFIDQYDRALQTFKGVVTRYNPSFHPRTFMGEMLLGYMGGMKNMRRSYTKAGVVIKGRNKEFLQLPGEAADEFAQGADKGLMQASNILRTAGRPAGAMNSGADGSKTIIQRKFGKDTQTLSADKIWHLYLESGLKSGFASTDLVKRTASPMLSGAMAKPSAVAQAVTEGVEDYGRLAHFIDVIQHSKARTLEDAVLEAQQTVRKFHLDYTAVTKFERNVMTRAAPFYKWIRLSTPLMAEILLTQPGKALMVPKAMRDFSEMAGYDPDEFGPFPGGADAVVPEWLRDQGAVPWMEYKGNTNYFSPSALFPLAGSADLAESGGFKAASPFFKWGADIYHGKDKMGNQLRGEASSNEDRRHYAASQTPQTNFLEQIITKRDPGIPREQSFVQFLANLGNQPNTEKRMRGEAFRQRQAAASNRKGAKKEAEKKWEFKP